MFNKFLKVFIVLGFAYSLPAFSSDATISKYAQELQALESNPEYKTIFDEDADPGLKEIQRNIEAYKELSYSQRAVRFLAFILESVMISSKTMPHLHKYIDSVVQKNGMETPVVFIALNRGFFNAMASKIFINSGCIVIGKKLLLESSEKQLEAIIAHELGHIKHNHINKSLLMLTGSIAGSYVALGYWLKKDFSDSSAASIIAKAYLSFFMGLGVNRLLSIIFIGKRFEQEADEFAYKVMDQGEGLKEFFETLQKKEQEQEDLFVETFNKIEANKSLMSEANYEDLKMQYNIIKLGQLINNFYRWLYHETPYGAHPSPAARIKAIEQYQAQKSAAH